MTIFHMLTQGSEKTPEGLSWPQFVERFFRQIGAEAEPWGKGLQVIVSTEQRRLVEGRPQSLFDWSWSWGGPPPEQHTLWRLAFEDRRGKTQTHPDGAELCVPGSFRGRQLIEAALRLWPVARTFVAPVSGPPADAESSSWSWRPFLVIHFQLTFVADGAQRRRTAMAVDLVSGEAAPWDLMRGRLACSPLELPKSEDGRTWRGWRRIPSESAVLSVGDACRQALERLQTDIAAEGDGWASEQRRRMDQEAERLRAYLRRAQLEENAEALHGVRAARLAELERRLPRVEADVAAVTVVYALTPGGR